MLSWFVAILAQSRGQRAEGKVEVKIRTGSLGRGQSAHYLGPKFPILLGPQLGSLISALGSQQEQAGSS